MQKLNNVDQTNLVPLYSTTKKKYEFFEGAGTWLSLETTRTLASALVSAAATSEIQLVSSFPVKMHFRLPSLKKKTPNEDGSHHTG